MTLEQLARATIGDEAFERIARNQGIANAIRCAEVRMYAEQHQERARWLNAKLGPKSG